MSRKSTRRIATRALVLVFVHAPSLLLAADAPLTLREAVRRAIEKAPELRAAEMRSAGARQRERGASSPFLPSLWITTTPGYASGLPVAVAGRVPSVAGAEASQTLYSASRRSAALDAGAAARLLEGEAARLRLATAREAALAYARVALADGRVALARRRSAALTAISRRVGARRDEGRATALEAARAELEEARGRHAVLDAEADRDLSRRELARLAEMDADSLVVLGDDAARIRAEGGAREAAVRAVEMDPVLRSLDEEIALRRRSVRLLGGWFAPEVDAEAQYARLSRANNFDEFYAKFKADDWSIGLSVAIPILTGGRRNADAGRARAELARAESEREARRRELEARAERAAAERERASAETALARRAAGLEEEALRLANVVALEGRGDADSVELAELERAKADEVLAARRADELKAELDLLEARGELLAVLLGPGRTGTEDRIE
ncbi:MAG TPA: TolC family protein [Thermoanaerobaculia bacterium]|jgi:outer membrane protein TolC|nr:TolC family protein [Thermoanaerobaculia bacterium]